MDEKSYIDEQKHVEEIVVEKHDNTVKLQDKNTEQLENKKAVNSYSRLNAVKKREEQKLTEDRLAETFRKTKTRKLNCKTVTKNSVYKSVERVVKKHWLKSDEKVTENIHYYGSSEQLSKNRFENAEALVQGVNIVKDFKADYRRSTDMKVKSAVGYQAFRQLSQFYAEFSSEGAEAFNAMVVKYGKDEVSAGRFEVLDKITGKIMDINPGDFDFSSDKAIASKAHNFENMSAMTETYRELLEDNPAYVQHLKETKTDDDNESFYDKVRGQMLKLTAMSDYYRIRKMIMSDSEYKVRAGDIEQAYNANDSKGTKHLKEMLRASYYIAANLNRVLGTNEFDDLELLEDTHYEDIDKVFNIRRQDIPDEGSDEYVYNRETSIRDELDRLQREGDSIADYDRRDCLGSLTDISRKVYDKKSKKFKKVNSINKYGAMINGVGLNASNGFYYDDIKKMRRTELKRKLLELRTKFKDNVFGTASFDSKKYPELMKLDINDNFNRLTDSILLDPTSDLSDSEVLEYVENQLIILTKRYDMLLENKKKIDKKLEKNEALTEEEKNLELIGDDEFSYCEEAYIDASMRNFYRYNAMFEKLEQELGAKGLILHPMDLMVKLPDELSGQLTSMFTISNIIKPGTNDLLKLTDFIKKYNRDYKRNKYRIDADKFVECADVYGGLFPRTNEYSAYVHEYITGVYQKGKGEQLDIDHDMLSTEKFRAIYKVIGNMGIDPQAVDECYEQHKDSEEIREAFKYVNHGPYANRVKISVYLYYHPEVVDKRLFKYLKKDGYYRIMSGSGVERFKKVFSHGYLKDLTLEQLKAYEEDLKRRKIPPINRDIYGKLVDENDPYGLNVFYEHLIRKERSENIVEGGDDAAAPTNVLSMEGDAFANAVKTSLTEIRKKLDEEETFRTVGHRPDTEIKVFKDGTNLGIESELLEKRSGEPLSMSEYRVNFKEEKELFTNTKGKPLAERLTKALQPDDIIIQVYLSNDPDFINENQEVIDAAERRFKGFRRYMEKRLILLQGDVDCTDVEADLRDSDGTEITKELHANKAYMKDIYDKNRYFSLTGFIKSSQQTTKGSSFANSLEMQFNIRGRNVPAEFIKQYRRDGMTLDDMRSERTGTNDEQDITNYTEFVNKVIPNFATHEVKIKTDHDTEEVIRQELRTKLQTAGIACTPEEFEELLINQLKADPRIKKNRDANIEYIRRSIIDGIVKHKSAVTARFDNRYITIYGIEGNKVKYYDSLSPYDNCTKIDTLDNLYRNSVQLVWFERIGVGSAGKLTSKADYNNGRVLTGQNKDGKNANSLTIRVDADKTHESHIEAMKNNEFIGENDELDVEDTVYLPKNLSFDDKPDEIRKK